MQASRQIHKPAAFYSLGPRANQDILEKKKPSLPAGNQTPDHPARRLMTSAPILLLLLLLLLVVSPGSYLMDSRFLSQWYSGRRVKLIIHRNPLARLRMSGAIYLLPLYAVMAWAVTTLPLL